MKQLINLNILRAPLFSNNTDNVVSVVWWVGGFANYHKDFKKVFTNL